MGERRVIGGHFEIVEMIGQGGMGSVFVGTDTLTGEKVAIKSLRPEIIALEPGILERFAREGEALRRLNHPSIVKVLAAVSDGDEHFIVMEYVGGGSLRDLMDEQGQLPVEQVMDIALDLADALTRAHRLHIIHRDIKPANVLLAEDGTPRLSDLGVARVEDSTMTQTGSMLGTPAYLAPEICAGNPADGRTDIWAFGVVLYEMLAGRLPYDEPSMAALFTAIATKPVPNLLRFRPDTPPLLAALIHRMLEKDHARRISSVRQVGAELEAILRGETTPSQQAGASRFETTPPSVEMEGPTAIGATPVAASTTRAKRGNLARFGLGVLIGIVVALAIIIVDSVSIMIQEFQATPTVAAVAPVAPGELMVLVAQIERQGGEARDVQRFVVDDLKRIYEQEIPFSKTRVRSYPAVITSDAQAREAAEANLAAAVIWGRYDESGVTLEVQVGSLAPFPYNPFPREEIEEIANVTVRLTDPRSQSVAFPLQGVFQVLAVVDSDEYGSGRYTAVGNLIKVESGEVVGSSLAARWSRMIALFEQEATEQALAETADALTLDAGNPFFYQARSLIRQKLGQLDLALEDAYTAQRLGPKGWALPLSQFGNDAFFLRNNMEDALQFYSQFLELRPTDWNIYSVRASIYYMQGQYDLARADAQRAIDLGPEANFPYFTAIGITLRQGRFADAQALFSTVMREFPDPTSAERILSGTLGSSASQNFAAPAIKAFGNLTLRQWSEVIAAVDEALATGVELSDLNFMQGLAYCNLRDYEKAEAAYTKGIEIDPDFPLLYMLRAEARQKQGDFLGALSDAGKVLESDQAALYKPLIAVSQSGAVNCENFLDVDLETLLAEATPEATNAPES